MSIQSEITRISGNVSDALDAVAAKGVTVAAGSNSNNLASLIQQIDTEDVFWATYGTTTSTEINTAFNEGKELLCLNGDLIYRLTEIYPENDYAIFTAFNEVNLRKYTIVCEEDFWGTNYKDAAPLVSPSFTGNPRAPTAATGTNTTQIATTAFVSNSISGLTPQGIGALALDGQSDTTYDSIGIDDVDFFWSGIVTVDGSQVSNCPNSSSIFTIFSSGVDSTSGYQIAFDTANTLSPKARVYLGSWGLWQDLSLGVVGIPAGGTTGQVLKKASGTNYDTEWGNAAASQKLASVTLSTNWTANTGYSTQTVTVSGATITAYSKVDLQPEEVALTHMISVGCNALYIENNNGVLTAYAIGNAPTQSLTMQCTVTEVS